MSYEIIWEPSGVIKRFLGHVTSNDLIQSVVEIEQDAHFDTLHYCINDFLGITGICSSMQDVEDISVIDKGVSLTNSRIKIAVVTTSPEVIFLANAYANSSLNSYPTKIFSTLDDSRTWLAANQPR